MNISLVRVGRTNFLNPSLGQPLGVMYLASYLRKFRNDNIKIIDMKLHNYEVSAVVKKALESSPHIVGLSCFTPDAREMHNVANGLRKAGFKGLIVSGGPHPSSDPEDVLKNKSIDIAVLGEGEDTFLRIVSDYEKYGEIKSFSGIARRLDRNNKIEVFERKSFIENLDEIPYPDWKLIEFEFYFQHITGIPLKKKRYMQILTSRGCPYRCVYCHNMFGKRFRTRSPENVLNEIKILTEKYNIEELLIIDDIFNLNNDRAERILDGIVSLNKKLNISFPTGLRADRLPESLIKKMKDAGTYYVVIAVENASDNMQRLMKKNLNLEKVKSAIELLKRENIFVNSSLLFGFPSERINDIIQTFKFIASTKLDMTQAFILNPFKGTEVARMLGINQTSNYDLYNYYTTRNYSGIPDTRFYLTIWFCTIYFYLNRARFIKTLWNAPKKSYFWRYAILWIFRMITVGIKNLKDGKRFTISLSLKPNGKFK